MTQPTILRLNKAGLPTRWITNEEAATLICKDQVLWTLGDGAFRLRGGLSRANGRRSTLDLPSILACSGDVKGGYFVPRLDNRLLFRRDQQMCMYCGQAFGHRDLTRDHIVPRAHGGRDTWNNVVAACRRCNNHKAARTPEEANMPLLAVPFEPNIHEFFYLANKNILADQMEFLKTGFSSRLQLSS